MSSATQSPPFPLAVGTQASSAAFRALVLRSTSLALLAGMLYALSPVSVVLAFVIAGLVWWTCRDMRGRERQWVIALLGSAVLVRVVAIGAIAMTADPQRASFQSIFGDGQYALARSMWLRNALLGVPMSLLDVAEAFNAYGRSIYYYPLAWLQVLFGPAPYALHLTSLIGYFAGAIALYRVVRSSYGRAAAFVGLTLLLWLPTLLLWSITPLKESLYFSASSLAVVATLRAVRTLNARRWLRALAACVLAAVAVAVAAKLRGGGLEITLGGLALGLALTPVFLHRRLVVAALLIAPIAAALAFRQPGIQERVLYQIRWGAERHVGYAMTPGSNYRLLGFEFYNRSRSGYSLTRPEALLYAGASFRDFVLIPKPWAPRTRNDVAMAPQQVLWYLVVVFSVPGLVAGLRRDPLLTCLLASIVTSGTVVIALASGNVGTLIRHRDMIVPFVIWLGALGAVVTVCRWGRLESKEGKQWR